MKKKLSKIGKRTVKNPFEYQVYEALQKELPRGSQLDYEQEYLDYVIEGRYLPDFVITRRDGTKIYIEAKGNGRAFDEQVKKKMIAVKKAHPLADIRVVFYSDGKVGRKRKNGSFMKQSDWANKYRFPFSIREVPKGWFR